MLLYKIINHISDGKLSKPGKKNNPAVIKELLIRELKQIDEEYSRIVSQKELQNAKGAARRFN